MGSVICRDRKTKTQVYEDEGNNKTTTSTNDEYIEEFVCAETDINENEMKNYELGGGGKILLVKQQGQLSALGTKCSHYGAMLNTGVLGDNRVRCPWHGACFNTTTGDIEDFPGLDSIPCYKVTVENGRVKVRAKKRDLEANKRIKDMVKRDPNDERTFVVIGGGPSAGVCVETLRQEGFGGRIIVVCKEQALPYDRIKLSKGLDLEISKLQYRDQKFYDEYSIETMVGVEATNLDTDTSTVSLSNGYSIKYDKLYIATGAHAKKANIPGADLKNVHTLRSQADAAFIHSLVDPDAHVVCLGKSFISLEVAAYFVGKVKKISVVGRGAYPLDTSLGDEVGKRILDLFEEKGVEMIMHSGIKQCIGPDGVVCAVELLDGRQIPCDILIMGTGTELCTAFLGDSGLTINRNGSIDTDLYLLSNVPDVYIGGDIANAPILGLEDHKATIGHYQLAQYHGKVAATNMVNGNKKTLNTVPFFWTVLFGKSFRYSGHGKHHELKIEGSLDDLKFVAFYFDESGNVIAIASCMRDPIVAQFAEYQSQGKRLHKNDLINDAFGWTRKLHKE